MGAWGTSLYANDTTCDIRGDYLDWLRRGKSNEETTKELILKYQELGGDPEEEPLFWFALADTQWNYGRLLPEVKEKALYFLGQDEELERWRESGEKQLKAWKNTLKKLGDGLFPFCEPDFFTNYTAVGWEGQGYNNSFEKYMIDMYLVWQNVI